MQLESFLARLFADSEFLENFLRDPRRILEESGLDCAEREAVMAIDRPGLLLASRSFTAKRQGKDAHTDALDRARKMWRWIIGR